MAIQRTLEKWNFRLNSAASPHAGHDASEALTAGEISTAMDAIIAENIFNTTGGELTSKAAARIVTRETADFELV